MSGEIEVGKCDVCGKEAQLSRQYYHYDIKCECHSPDHFEIVRHCENCTPKPPETTKVSLKLKPVVEPDEPCEVREYDDCAYCGHYGHMRKTNDGPLLCFKCHNPATKIDDSPLGQLKQLTADIIESHEHRLKWEKSVKAYWAWLEANE